MASFTLEVPVKFSPIPSLSASTHQRCQRKEWRRRVPKSEILRSGSFCRRSTFSHILALARA
ncbi:hypothetical protein D3C78_1827140 [compost metagenome]